MNKVLTGILAAAAVFATSSARAETISETQATDLSVMMATLTAPSALDLINWKVGDTMKYKVTIFGMNGSNDKSVTKDEGTAIWVTQDMNLVIQKQKAEMLINKADAKILKMIVNGQEQQIPDDKPEIISQDAQEVTVPAGTFQSIHIVAKTQQVSKIEVWANPRDSAMDGTLKQIATTQFGPVTMELTSFTRMP